MNKKTAIVVAGVAALLLGCLVCAGGGGLAWHFSGGAKAGGERTIAGLMTHFQRQGFEVRDLGPASMVADAADSRFVVVDGVEAGVYQFNTADPVQRKAMEQVQRDGTFGTFRLPARINAPLMIVLTGNQSNRESVLKAFASF